MREISVLMFCFFIFCKIEAQSILSIHSRPDSANVYIENAFCGKTPLELTNINGVELTNIDGVYKTITLQKDSLKIWRNIIFLKKGSSEYIYAIMDSDYGLLTLHTNPSGANVFINDSLVGITPLNEQKIKTGFNYLKIEKENYSPWGKFIEIPTRLINMNVDLVSLFGSLSFNNISTDQNLYIDGLLLDKNNLKNLTLPIGNHEVHLLDTKSNKQVYDDINVAPGNHYDVSFNYDQFSFKPLLFSAIIPGMGQIYNKSYMKGTLIFLSTIASGFFTQWAINNYQKKNDEYDLLQDKYYTAKNEADADYYHSMTQNAYEKTNTASTLKNLSLCVLAGIYIYNLLDAILFSGKIDAMHYYQQNNQFELKNEIGYKRIGVGVQWNL